MKRRYVVYGLLGAIGLVVGISIVNPIIADKFCDKEKSAVSVVVHNNKYKYESVSVATGDVINSTTEAISSYASDNTIQSENQSKKEKKSEKQVFVKKPKVTENPRKAIVKMAKSYKGKIEYLWGGKPSDAQIEGKDQPEKLDCSGFIQFIYSKYSKKRISSLGSTIAIAGLPEIKKNQLKQGDIGLRNGTGSIYFDADGKTYYEPDLAKKANEDKEKLFENKIKEKKEKRLELKKKIKEKKKIISEFEDKKIILQDKTSEEKVESLDDGIVDDENQGEVELDKEEQTNEVEKIEAELKKYNQKIKKCESDIIKYSKKIKKYDKQLKKLKKQVKKYKKDIEESIDHVGIYCGKNKKGQDVWCHCSSSKGGVVYEVTDIFTHYYSTSDCLPR